MYNQIDDKPYVTDVMEEIAKVRNRIEALVTGPKYKSNPHWSWMEGWLQKTDKEHFEHELNDDNYYAGHIGDKYCNVCGKKDRFFLSMDFSFCNEYGCGIKICGECLKEMLKILENGVMKALEKEARGE